MAVPRFTWPIPIVLGADAIVVSVAGGPDRTLTFTASTYRWSITGAWDMAVAFQALLNTHPDIGGNTFTCTLNLETGILTTSYSAGDVIVFRWTAGGVTLPAATIIALGFDATADETWTISTTGDYVVGNAWFPNIDAVDDREVPVRIGSYFEPASVAHSIATTFAEWGTREVIIDYVTPCRSLQHHADASAYAAAEGLTVGDPNAPFQTLWDRLWQGGIVYYHEAAVTGLGTGYYMWDDRADLRQHLEVLDPGGTWYRVRCWLKRDTTAGTGGVGGDIVIPEPTPASYGGAVDAEYGDAAGGLYELTEP